MKIELKRNFKFNGKEMIEIRVSDRKLNKAQSLWNKFDSNICFTDNDDSSEELENGVIEHARDFICYKEDFGNQKEAIKYARQLGRA